MSIPPSGSADVRAVVYDHYGPADVLRVEDVEKPVPKEDEVLVKVHATTVNRFDVHTREANAKAGPAVSLLSRLVSGFPRPRRRILGSEFAGEVVGAGAAVTEFVVGDRVFGNTGMGFGTHAEFVCVRESGKIAPMPARATFEEAAPVTDGALNSLWCLRLADLRKGQKVLIYGASGSLGTAAVQIAKYLDVVRSIGADRVIDYTQEDFTKNGETYDVIFDAVGKDSFKRCKDSLKPGGRYLACDGLMNLILAVWTPRFGDKKVIFQIPPRWTKEEVRFLKELIEAGRYRVVIDRCYPLEDVIEATRYVETEHKTGNVVLTVN